MGPARRRKGKKFLNMRKKWCGGLEDVVECKRILETRKSMFRGQSARKTERKGDRQNEGINSQRVVHIG